MFLPAVPQGDHRHAERVRIGTWNLAGRGAMPAARTCRLRPLRFIIRGLATRPSRAGAQVVAESGHGPGLRRAAHASSRIGSTGSRASGSGSSRDTSAGTRHGQPVAGPYSVWLRRGGIDNMVRTAPNTGSRRMKVGEAYRVELLERGARSVDIRAPDQRLDVAAQLDDDVFGTQPFQLVRSVGAARPSP
jgi:hypothetical protein